MCVCLSVNDSSEIVNQLDIVQTRLKWIFSLLVSDITMTNATWNLLHLHRLHSEYGNNDVHCVPEKCDMVDKA